MRRIMRAATPKKCARFCHCAVLVDQTQVRLVHQRRALQGVIGVFEAELAARDTP
jgi:hypothetical protein